MSVVVFLMVVIVVPVPVPVAVAVVLVPVPVLLAAIFLMAVLVENLSQLGGVVGGVADVEVTVLMVLLLPEQQPLLVTVIFVAADAVAVVAVGGNRFCLFSP